MGEREKTLEASLRIAIKDDAKRYKEMGANPTHCLMHPDTWIWLARDGTLSKPEREKAERGEAYKLGYSYRRAAAQYYDSGYGHLMCYPSEKIEYGAAMICDAATASLFVDELLAQNSED